MTEFHFLRPEWLWGLAVLLLLPLLAGKGRSNGGLWRDFCDRILLRPQLVAGTGAKTFVPAVLAGACWVLAVLSLAGPAWERLPQPAVKKGVDTVYLLDISVFMTPSDVKPSRMDRARFKLHDFLQKSKDGQNALVLYDNEPFVAVPLTQDVKVIDQMLPSVQAGMMGGRTPDAAKALDQARALLKQAGSVRGRVVMIGAHVSGRNLAAARKAAEKLKSDGFPVSVLGVGTGHGAPLQMPDGTFLKSGGKPVLSALTADNLEKIAVSGGGVYRAAGLDDADVDAIAGVAADAGGVSAGSNTDVKADAWRDFGAVLCWLILPFAALGYRKGWLGVLLLALMPVQARADVSDLWTRSERKEALRIAAGEKPADANVFSDRGWRGVALYKSGDFRSAAAVLGNPDDAETRYNLGNALAQAGQYQQAIEAYKKVLEENPNHADAAFNKKYLEDRLKNNQQQNQQQNQQDQQQQNQEQPQNQPQNGGRGQQGSNQPQNRNQQQAEPESAGQGQNGQEREQAQDQREQDGQRENKARQPESAGDEGQRENQPQSAGVRPQNGDEQKRENGQSAPSGQKSDPDEREKREQMQWLSVIRDDPSGLLRERIRRRNLMNGGVR